MGGRQLLTEDQVHLLTDKTEGFIKCCKILILDWTDLMNDDDDDDLVVKGGRCVQFLANLPNNQQKSFHFPL